MTSVPDFKTLAEGLSLLVLIPALLLFQSFQDNPAETPGTPPYHTDQQGNHITEYLVQGNTLSLLLLMEYFLELDHNSESAQFWLDELKKEFGDDCMICAGRGYLSIYKKDFMTAQKEFNRSAQMLKSPMQKTLLRQFRERHSHE